MLSLDNEKFNDQKQQKMNNIKKKEIYKSFCKYCNQIQPHIPAYRSRKRGFRLICLICNTIQPKYTNFGRLQDFNLDKEFEKEIQEEKSLDDQKKQLKTGEKGLKAPKTLKN